MLKAAGRIFLYLLAVAIFCASPVSAEPRMFDWQELPALPTPISGQFVGVSNGALIVVGGTNFPIPLFEGGTKEWYDTVYVLEHGSDKWRSALNLGYAPSYGGMVSTSEGLICIGGGDAKEHFTGVFLLKWANGKMEKVDLPSLPEPTAYCGAALLGNTVYLAGGQSSPKSTTALKKFWALDLSAQNPGWREIDPWPGPARILASVAAQDGAVYVIGGCELNPDSEGKAVRTYLTDGYAYTPGKGWKRIANLPSPVTAAPAAAFGPSHILVFSGDTGEFVHRIAELKDNHPGFSRDILAYHTITDTWAKMGSFQAGLVTTGAVNWQGGIVIPGGEDRPGHRSDKVLSAIPMKPTRHFFALDYTVLGIYLLALVGMGFYFSRREKTTEDFFLAGRRIPWWAAGLSIFGTQLSAITFMAIPAKVYATNWIYILGNFCILAVAPLVIFFYLPFFRRLNVTTAYEYLEKRFNVGVRLFGSASFILFQLGRMGVVLFLPSIALSAVTGIDIVVCILVMGVLTTLYTVLGGIEAVVWTDVLQVFVFIGGAILSLFVVASKLDGGLTEGFAMAQSAGKFHTFTWSWDYTIAAVWVVVIGNLLSNLVPYTTDQAVIQRYLTTRDERESRKAIWTNAVLSIPAAFLFFGVGTALYLFYRQHPGLLNPAMQTDAIFPMFIAQQLPVGITGLVVAGLFAAAMSTLDSSINSISTAVVTDFYRRFRAEVTDHHSLVVARWLTVILGAVGIGSALFLASADIKSLWDVFITILGLTGGALAGVFILGIFTRRANGVGTLIGAFSGAAVLYWVQGHTSVHFFLYAAVGIVATVIIGYLASLVIPHKRRSLAGLTIYTLETKSEEGA